MNIKEEFYRINNNDINKEYIESIKKRKNNLSNTDKRFLLSIIGKFKQQEIEKTLKAIRLYAIWNPDEAIMESRKKGVFRYKAYGFKKNKALYLLKNLLTDEFYKYSIETINYLTNKIEISYIYTFYKKSEDQLVKYIKNYKATRIRRGNNYIETAIFKDLLAYIDFYFISSLSLYDSDNSNKNKLTSYSKEEICEGISYIIYLYDKVIGIREDINYFTNSRYVLSNEIEDIILLACKVNQLEEWELCIDYFNYETNISKNELIIFDKNKMLEKTIKMGYIRNKMQAENFYVNTFKDLEDVVSIAKLGEYIEKKLGDSMIKEISDGKLSRFRFEFPERLFSIFKEANVKDGMWFKEEIFNIQYGARELVMSFDDVVNKKITNNCNLTDVILFQRLFLLINEIINKVLYKKKDKHKVISSLIPLMRQDILIGILNKIMDNETKVKELLKLFTYNKGIKLDLQYTPFLHASGGIIFSNSLVVKSNLIRNSIAYSYQCKNQIANNDQGLEPLVQTCSEVFKKCKKKYDVRTNVKYKYKRKEGEIDVLVISDSDIILIECKCPINPINNFEMRSSLDHIEKANKQLNLSKDAFNNKEFRKVYFKNWGIEDKNQNIRTCIIFGNRLFTGYSKYAHPIRYIYELDMILNEGIIHSKLGEWSVWEGKEFSHNDLINFLSEDKSFVKFNLESMDEIHEKMYVNGKKIIFKTFALNICKSFKKYDSNLKIIKSNDELKKNFIDSMKNQNL